MLRTAVARSRCCCAAASSSSSSSLTRRLAVAASSKPTSRMRRCASPLSSASAASWMRRPSFDYHRHCGSCATTNRGHRRRIASLSSSCSTMLPIARAESTTIRSLATTAAAVDSDDSDSDSDDDESSTAHHHHHYPGADPYELSRLSRIRNVGILAHVDAGKTTVTERMLALAGIVRSAGNVDDGNTVTDYLPAERERGITIQSAAVSFDWGTSSGGSEPGREGGVEMHLIDTPGHVDFTVEVHRSVAVLDGAVLVVDAVAGCQAQTETVWRALNSGGFSGAVGSAAGSSSSGSAGGAGAASRAGATSQRHHHHEPLPCLALVNKMDKEGCSFDHAVSSLQRKLPGARPVPIQIPLFAAAGNNNINNGGGSGSGGGALDGIIALPVAAAGGGGGHGHHHSHHHHGEFIGLVDLIQMRAVIYPQNVRDVSDVERNAPRVHNLVHRRRRTNNGGEEDGDEEGDAMRLLDPECPISQIAYNARNHLVEHLAEHDHVMEELYLNDATPTSDQLRTALRRATLNRSALPVLCGAALKGRGVEPLLDAMSELLPGPLDRLPPALIRLRRQQNNMNNNGGGGARRRNKNGEARDGSKRNQKQQLALGHPLHRSLLALAFKVVHMKGRGGSGDGRVVFCRVYSGKIQSRDKLKVISPPGSLLNNSGGGEGDDDGSSCGTAHAHKPRTERVGGMLELSGGKFDNLEDGLCKSGDVCALVGLKSVSTGDTVLLASDPYSFDDDDRDEGGTKKKGKGSNKKRGKGGGGAGNTNGPNHGGMVDVCLAGVSAPRPVLTVRVEADSTEHQSRLSDALRLLSVEDPSLVVEETGAATLLSGLGELHIEVVLDRLRREFGLEVRTGPPAVSYRETVTGCLKASGDDGAVEYDRTVGGTRMQASVRLVLEPMSSSPEAIDCPNGDGGEASTTAAESSPCLPLVEPVVTLGPRVREYLGARDDLPEDDLAARCDMVRNLVAGCRGSLRRGCLGPYPLANVRCTVLDVDAEGGLQSLASMPGSLRAAAAHAVSIVLSEHTDRGGCTVLEPTMFVEVTVPRDMVGSVLSDLTGRRGTVGDVLMGEDGDGGGGSAEHARALVQAEVPLAEILGYASGLRSLTGGEGAFTAEYKGHSPCDVIWPM